MKKSIANTTIIVMSFSMLTRLIAFAFKVFLSRTVGAEALGLFSMGLAMFGLLTMIPSSGIPLCVSRRVAELETPRQASGVVTAGLVVTLLVNIVTIVLFLLFRHPLLGLFADNRAEHVILIMLPATFSTCIYNVLRAFLMGRKHYVCYSVTETCEEIVNVITALVLMYGGFFLLGGSEMLAYAFLAGDVLSLALLIVLYIAMKGRLGRPVNALPIIKSSTPITLMRLFTSLAGTFVAIILPNRMVAGGYTVSQATIAYGEAVGMAYPLLFAPLAVTSALSVVLLPELAQLSHTRQYKQVAAKVDAAVHYITLITGFFFVVFAALGKPLGLIIYDNAAAGSFVAFGAGMAIPLCLAQLTNTALNSMGLERRCFVNTLIGLAAMTICLWFLPSLLGVYALAVAQTAFLLVCFVLNMFALSRHNATNMAFCGSFFKICIGALCVTMGVQAFYAWIRPALPPIASVAMAGALGAMLYAGWALVSKTFDIRIITTIFRKRRRVAAK